MKTIKEVYSEWVLDKKNYVKQSTLCSYCAHYKNHVEPYFGDKRIDEIDNNLINDLILKLSDKKLSSSTVSDVCVVVKMLVEFYCEKENIPSMRFKLKYPKNEEGKRKIQAYSNSDQKKILEYLIENHNNENLAIAITLCTGVRIGEICALTWGDIDLENKLIHIRRTVMRVHAPEERGNFSKFGKELKTKIIFSTPKTQCSYRDVPIASMLLPILKNYKKIMKDNYFVNTGSIHLLEPRTFRAHYNRIMTEDVKIENVIHFHGLRHSFATRLIDSGVDIKTTSNILGHSKVELTMNLYVHPTDESKMKAVNSSLKKLMK